MTRYLWCTLLSGLFLSAFILTLAFAQDVKPPQGDVKPPVQEVKPPLPPDVKEPAKEDKPLPQDVKPPVGDVKPPIQDVKPPEPDLVKPPTQKDKSSEDVFKDVIQKAQDEYRLYFREPKSAVEFWTAAAFEIQVGKFDVAAFHLNKLVSLPEKERDDDLLKIEQREGLNTFFRLRLVKEWSKDPALEKIARNSVDALIDSVLMAVKRHLGDRERITRLVNGLFDKVPEMRSFSLIELKRTKHFAAPVLAEALLTATPEARNVLKNAMAALDPDIMPPLFELYGATDDKDDVRFQLDLLWIAKTRLEKRVVPYLWHMSSSTRQPKIVRDEAKETLAYLLGTSPGSLPAAHVALTKVAEDYYHYKLRLPEVAEFSDAYDPVKPPGESGETPKTTRPDKVRLDLGLRFARQAVDLEKGYLPAQSIYLAFLLEETFTRKPYEGQLDKLLLEKPAPTMQQLLGKIDADLLATVLERAMAEQNYAVMLPLIEAAGDRREVRLAQPLSGNTPGLLVRLLYYPDSRVQFAAARALLSLPAPQTPFASTRTVDVLQRFLAAGSTPKVLIAYAKDERAALLRAAAKEAGYDSAVAVNVKHALELLHASADFDAIILNDDLPQAQLPHVLTSLRGDASSGRLPLLMVAAPTKQLEVAAMSARTTNVFPLPEAWAVKGSELKRQIEDAIKLAAAPEPLRKAPEHQQYWLESQVRRGKGQALSEQERKRFARSTRLVCPDGSRRVARV